MPIAAAAVIYETPAVIYETLREMKTLDADSAASLRVLISGPTSKVNDGLSECLCEMDGIVVVGVETDVAKALILTETQKPDVVLLDFETDGFAFLHTIALFRKIKPQPAIIVLAQILTTIVRRHCSALGAESVFEKTTELDQLFDALQKLRGRKNGDFIRETY